MPHCPVSPSRPPHCPSESLMASHEALAQHSRFLSTFWAVTWALLSCSKGRWQEFPTSRLSLSVVTSVLTYCWEVYCLRIRARVLFSVFRSSPQNHLCLEQSRTGIAGSAAVPSSRLFAWRAWCEYHSDQWKSSHIACLWTDNAAYSKSPNFPL